MSDSYDAIKFNYKTKNLNLAKRKDKYFFDKLARFKDPKGLLLANLSFNPNAWIGKLFEPDGQKRYWNWIKFRESLTYLFRKEIKQLSHNAFEVHQYEHPELLRLYLRHNITLDTMVILDDFVHYSQTWDNVLKDDLVWQRTRFLILKYRPFVVYDKSKIFTVMSEIFVDIHA